MTISILGKIIPQRLIKLRYLHQVFGETLTTVLEWVVVQGHLEAFSDLNCIGVDLCERSLNLQHIGFLQPAWFAKIWLSLRRIARRLNLWSFRAIGYLEPKKQLPIALRRAYETLAPDGLLIIEPWVSEEGFVKKQAFYKPSAL